MGGSRQGQPSTVPLRDQQPSLRPLLPISRMPNQASCTALGVAEPRRQAAHLWNSCTSAMKVWIQYQNKQAAAGMEQSWDLYPQHPFPARGQVCCQCTWA